MLASRSGLGAESAAFDPGVDVLASRVPSPGVSSPACDASCMFAVPASCLPPFAPPLTARDASTLPAALASACDACSPSLEQALSEINSASSTLGRADVFT
jgi:hypothetical protein